MEMPIAGYFVAALLCYYAYAKKGDRGRRAEVKKKDGCPGEIENKRHFT